MKYIKLIIALTLLLFYYCKKPTVSDALYDLSIDKKEIQADGQTLINISVKIKSKSSSDRRKVIFTTSSGKFSSSGSNECTVSAEFEDGNIIAKTSLKAPLERGTIKITVKPEFDSPIQEFTLEDSVIARLSLPVSIKIEPSSFGISSNFMNEVQITGVLKNQSNKFVSKGVQVVFEDYLEDGTRANGQMRKLKDITTDSSIVSVFYSSKNYPIGTTIKIKAIILDTLKIKTQMVDSVLLTVNQ